MGLKRDANDTLAKPLRLNRSKRLVNNEGEINIALIMPPNGFMRDRWGKRAAGTRRAGEAHRRPLARREKEDGRNAAPTISLTRVHTANARPA